MFVQDFCLVLGRQSKVFSLSLVLLRLLLQLNRKLKILTEHMFGHPPKEVCD